LHLHSNPLIRFRIMLGRELLLAILCVYVLASGEINAQEREPDTVSVLSSSDSLTNQAGTLWVDDVGNGFEAGANTFSASAVGGVGFKMFGSKEEHDLALLSLSYGRMLGGLHGKGWYRGNYEFRLELFTGAQVSPSTEWMIGLTPHLRYDLATGTRWVPFADFGAGVSATSIGPPDLSGTFEFNLQAAFGTHYFFAKNLAGTVEARYLHMSCAGINHPNLGINSIMGVIGVSWLF
jgi:lipid A 3-O-deacylase